VASIQKRTRNGKTSYRVQYRDPAGRQRGKVFARKVDADAFLIQTEHAKRTGGYVDPAAGKVKFGEWAERWYRTTAGLKPGTRRTYRQLLDNQLLPAFADAQLVAIDKLAVRELLAGLVEGGLSTSRIRNAHQVLGQILTTAVEGGRLARNQAAGVRLPRITPSEMHFLTAAQVEVLAEAVDARYRALVVFDAYTGLRAGELAALRVKHFDPLRGVCHVVEAATEVGSRLEWGTTKSWERRTVRLPRFLGELVAAHLAGRPHAPEDLVFTSPLGGPLRERKFAAEYFKPAVRVANETIGRQGEAAPCALLPEDLRVHDLRHTAASLMIHQGATIKAVQKTLGHKSAVVTLDRYGHLWPDELEDLAERLDQAHGEALAAHAKTRVAGGMLPRRSPEVVQLHKRPGR
jgi:integrase